MYTYESCCVFVLLIQQISYVCKCHSVVYTVTQIAHRIRNVIFSWRRLQFLASHALPLSKRAYCRIFAYTTLFLFIIDLSSAYMYVWYYISLKYSMIIYSLRKYISQISDCYVSREKRERRTQRDDNEWVVTIVLTTHCFPIQSYNCFTKTKRQREDMTP